MKKIILFLFIIISVHSVYAEEQNTGYNLYQQRVEEICSPYLLLKKGSNDSSQIKLIFNTQEYINYDEDITSMEDEKKVVTYGTTQDRTTDDLKTAKNTYANNMNNIYKCAILSSQYKSYNLIKNDLINYSAGLSTKVGDKIDDSITKINGTIDTLDCIPSNKTNKNSIQKLQVLKQTTYEICRYNAYIEYLKTRTDGIKNEIYNSVEQITPNTTNNQGQPVEIKSSKSIQEVIEIVQNKQNAIESEIDRAYKIFPIAFHAYSEYENNLSIHLLLEIVKEDFYVYRKNLHEVINPINQVVYKISNAMKK